MDKQEVIDIAVPMGWTDLSQGQLRYFFIMLNACGSMEQVITRCFLKWGGIKVVARSSKSMFLLRKGKRLFEMSSEDLWLLMKPVYFLYEMPELPVVLKKYGRHKAVDSVFKGVSFGKYLSCVAVWSEMMKVGKPEIENLKDLVSHLYGFRPKRLLPEFAGCVVYWMTSLQEFFAKRFKDLFAPATSDGQGSLGASSYSFSESMNAMVRALTKGDVLKEKEVLEIDVWRALTELNAQAKESRQINESVKRK